MVNVQRGDIMKNRIQWKCVCVFFLAFMCFIESCEQNKDAKTNKDEAVEVSIAELEDIISEYSDKTAGDYIPGSFILSHEEMKSLNAIGGPAKVKEINGHIFAFGSGWNKSNQKREHWIAIDNTEINLTELPGNYIAEDFQVNNNTVSIIAYPFQSGGSDGNDKSEKELELFDFSFSGELKNRIPLKDLLNKEHAISNSVAFVDAIEDRLSLIDYQTGKIASFDENLQSLDALNSPVYRIIKVFQETSTDYGLLSGLDENKLLFTVISSETHEIKETYEFPNNGFSSCYKGSFHKFLLANEYGIYGFNASTMRVEQLLRFTDYGIDYLKIQNIAEQGDGSISIVQADIPGVTIRRTMLKTLSITDDQEVSSVENITVSCLQSDELIRYAVKMFNDNNKEVRAVLKEYYDKFQTDATLEDAMTRMNSDIMDGTCGDVIVFNGLDKVTWRSDYVESDAFVDLYSFMDEDRTFNKNAYFTNVWKANEINGKLINLTSLFSLRTMICAEETVNELPHIEDVILEKDRKETLIRKLFGESYLLDDYLKDMILYITGNDLNEQSILFQPEILSNYIELAKYFPSAGDSDIEYVDLSEKNQLLYGSYNNGKKPMGRFLSYLRYASAFFNSEGKSFSDYENASEDEIIAAIESAGTDIVYSGFPGLEEKGSSIINLISFGIMKSSKNYKNSWAFIKSTLDSEFQKGNENYAYYTIPVNRSIFESSSELTEEEMVTMDPAAFSELSSGREDDDKAAVRIIPFVDSGMIEETENLIDTIEKTDEVEPVIYEVIHEEVLQYLEGNATENEAADNISIRLKLYASERR